MTKENMKEIVEHYQRYMKGNPPLRNLDIDELINLDYLTEDGDFSTEYYALCEAIENEQYQNEE
jgi:hypothetical protein